MFLPRSSAAALVLLVVLAALLAACGSAPAAPAVEPFALAATVAANGTQTALIARQGATPGVAIVATAPLVATATAAPATPDSVASAQANAAVAAARATTVALATAAAEQRDIRATAAAAAGATEVAAATGAAQRAAAPTAVAQTAASAAPAAPSAALPTALAPTAPPETPSPLAPSAKPPTAEPPTAAPQPAPPVVADCASPCDIRFAELYAGASLTGPIPSEKALALSGKQVVMRGFMAPPLSPDTTFFVLTKDPMVFCPFCSSAADWPFDIVYIKMAGGRSVPTLVPTAGIAVVGRFEVGAWTDPETGFVSLIRIVAEEVQVVQ